MKTGHTDAAFRRLCKLCHRLGVTVITPIHWPRRGHLSRVCGAYSGAVNRRNRKLLDSLRATAPVIFLTRESAPRVLAHGLGHHVSGWSDFCDERTGNENVSSLLDRVAARHGLDSYCRSTRREMRAECVDRRLLGETLPPTLRRFTERRAWQELRESGARK